MITVNIKLHPGFQAFVPKGMAGRRIEFVLPDSSTLEFLLNEKIGIPQDLPKLIIVNGIHSEPLGILKQNDRVTVFMPTAGG